MSPSKNIILLSIITTVSVLIVKAGVLRSGNLSIGQREPGDNRILFLSARRPAEPGIIVNSTHTMIAPTSQYINYVTATNVGGEGNGGYAKIVDGGIGEKEVSIGLFNQKGQSLFFDVEVYSKPYDNKTLLKGF